LDVNNNIWLIDFFWTGQFHILKDIGKLENDVAYQYTQLTSPSELEEAITLSITFTDPCLPLTNIPPPGVTSEHIIKAWKTIHYMRNTNLFKKNFDTFAFLVTMLRYALFSMCLKVLSNNQKTWALWSACLYADRLRRYLWWAVLLKIQKFLNWQKDIFFQCLLEFVSFQIEKY